MGTNATVNYRYINRQFGVTGVWISWPSDAKKIEVNPQPVCISMPDLAGNELAYFELQKGDAIELSYDVAFPANRKTKGLSEEERSFYLRSTSLVPATNDIKQLAQSITHGAKTEEEMAYKIFLYMRKNYSYKFPPKERGADSFFRSKKGDCGEFSFLYAACCRVLQIPCRICFGAFAVGTMQAHAWNEVYLEDKGWVPVDVSMAAVQLKQPWRFLFSDIKTQPSEKYFGHLEGQRLIFSIETELQPKPDYPSVKRIPEGAYAFRMAGEKFFWGYQLLHGKIPYLQPAYVAFPDNGLTTKWDKYDSDKYLGKWKIIERGWRHWTFLIKRVALWFLPFSFLLNLFTSSQIFSFFLSGSLLLYALCSVIRGERRWIFLVIAALSIISIAKRLW